MLLLRSKHVLMSFAIWYMYYIYVYIRRKNDKYAYSTPCLWTPTILKRQLHIKSKLFIFLENSCIAIQFISHKSPHLKCTSGQSRS